MEKDFGKLWFCTPRLFFKCSFIETADSEPVPMELMLVTTFEEFPDQGTLPERAGCLTLYEPAPIPTMYVTPVSHAVSRVTLMPVFLHGNINNTVPHTWKGAENPDMGLKKDSKPPKPTRGRGGRGGRAAPAAPPKLGSRLYQVNMWLWKHGRPTPRLCTVEEGQERRAALQSDRAKAGARTRQENREREAENTKRRHGGDV